MSTILVNNIDDAYNNINAEIQDNIYDNNNQEITAAKVRQVLNEINTQTNSIELQLGTIRYKATVYRNLIMEWNDAYSSKIHYDPDWSVFRLEIPIGGSFYAYSDSGPQMETIITPVDLDSRFNYEELQNDHSASYNLYAYNIWNEGDNEVYNLFNPASSLNWCNEDEGELYFDLNNNNINILINVENQQDTMRCMSISLENDDEVVNYDTPWDFIPNYDPDNLTNSFKYLYYDNDVMYKISSLNRSNNQINYNLSQLNTGKFVDFATNLNRLASGRTYLNGNWINTGGQITWFYKIPRFTEIEFSLNSSAQHIGIFDNAPYDDGQLAYLSCNPIYNYDEPGTYARQLTWNDTDKSGNYKFINNSDRDLYICWENGHNPTNFSINGYDVISNGVYEEDIPEFYWERTLTQRLMNYITRMNEAINELLEQ